MRSAPAAQAGTPARALDEAVRSLVLAILVGALVVFDPRAGHQGGRPKYLLVVAGGVTAALLLAAARRPVLRDNPLRWPLLAVVVWAAISTAASSHPRTAFFGFAGSYDGLLSTACLAVLFVATAHSFGPGSVPRALKVLWFGAGTVVLAFGLAQLVDSLVSRDTGWDWARPGISPWTIGSTLGNPNHLGGLLAMLLPLAAVLAILAEGRRRALVIAGAGVALGELAVTASRGAWLGLVAAAVVLAVLLRRELRPHRRRVAVMTGGAVAVMVVVLAVLGPTGVTKIDPGSVFRTGPGSTLDLRFEVWSSALRVTADNPVAGVGPDVFPLVFPAYESDRFLLLYGPFTLANGAHNIFVNTLANLGVGGLVAFLAVLVAAGVSLRRAWPRLGPQDRLVAGGLSAAVVAYLVQACLNTQSLSLSVCFWTLLGLLVALTSRHREGMTL